MKDMMEEEKLKNVTAFISERSFWKIFIGAIAMHFLLTYMASILVNKLELLPIFSDIFWTKELYFGQTAHNDSGMLQGLLNAVSSSFGQVYLINGFVSLVYETSHVFSLDIWSEYTERWSVISTVLVLIFVTGFLISKAENTTFGAKIFGFVFALLAAGLVCEILEFFIYGNTGVVSWIYEIENNFLGNLGRLVGFEYANGAIMGRFNLADVYLVGGINLMFTITVFYLALLFAKIIKCGGNDHFLTSWVPHDRQIPREIQRDVYIRDGGVCRFCGAAENLELDHVIPYSKGGSSKDSKNIQLLCIACNRKKGSDF